MDRPVAGFRNLRLKDVVRFMELDLPADRDEPGDPVELAVRAMTGRGDQRIAGARWPPGELTGTNALPWVFAQKHQPSDLHLSARAGDSERDRTRQPT